MVGALEADTPTSLRLEEAGWGREHSLRKTSAASAAPESRGINSPCRFAPARRRQMPFFAHGDEGLSDYRNCEWIAVMLP